MSAPKKVDFIERVSKTILGLEGLQIVVYCDRKRREILSEEEKQECTFLETGERMLKEVDGEIVKRKYNIKEGVEFGNRLHEERVNWMKNI